jgi:hypothetical protein
MANSIIQKSLSADLNAISNKVDGIRTIGIASGDKYRIVASNINVFWFPFLYIIGDYIASCYFQGSGAPNVKIIVGAEVGAQTIKNNIVTDSNGATITIPFTGMRGTIILCAPTSVLNTLSISRI